MFYPCFSYNLILNSSPQTPLKLNLLGAFPVFSLSHFPLASYIFNLPHERPFTLHWQEVLSLSTYCPCSIFRKPKIGWQMEISLEGGRRREVKEARSRILSARHRVKTINIYVLIILSLDTVWEFQSHVCLRADSIPRWPPSLTFLSSEKLFFH